MSTTTAIIAGIGAILVFGLLLWGYRAGRNRQNVDNSRTETSVAQQETATRERMSAAQAQEPQTDAELFAKMEKGEEGQ